MAVKLHALTGTDCARANEHALYGVKAMRRSAEMGELLRSR